MSEEIHGVPWDRLPGAEKEPEQVKYPWDKWFNGRTHLLLQGEDFTREIEDFRRYVYEMAVARGVRVRTKPTRDRRALYLRKTGARKRRVDPVIDAVLRGEPVQREPEEN